MTEPCNRAQRALRRASSRENSSGHYEGDKQQGKIRNNDPSNNENPTKKAVAHSRIAVQPPLATTTTNSTTTAALAPADDSTNYRKRSSSSAPTVAYSVSTNTRSKKQRSSEPSAPAAQAQQVPPRGNDDVDDDDAASAEAVGYRLKSAAAAAAKAAATVTPAVPRRQILFGNDEATTKKEQPDSADTAAANTTSNTSTLPDGVVDIYPSPRALSSSSEKTCHCVAEISLEQRAGFLHTAHYGAEWQAYLFDKENREYPKIVTSSSSSCAASPFGTTHTQGSCNSNDESLSSVQQDDSPDSTASKSSSSLASSLSSSSSSTASSPSTTTPTPGSLLRFDVRASKDTPRFLEEAAGNLKRQPYINARMRAVLVSWLVEVGTEYDISDQAFHLAITLLDLMLAKGPTDVKAWEETCRRRSLRPAYNDDSSDHDSGDATAEPDCFVVQRGAFQAFGWYVQYTA